MAGALAAVLRTAPAPRVFTDGGVRFSGNDAYYHALRVERTLKDFPQVPSWDPSLSFPDGAPIPWPPLFDGAVAGIARLVGGPEGGVAIYPQVAAWAPVALGILTVLGVGGLGALLLGPLEGALAALAMAVLPAHVAFTRVGDFDQHGAEVLILVCAFWAMAASLDDRGKTWRRWSVEASLAVMVASAFLVWQGSVLHLGVMAGGLAACWLTAGPGSEMGRQMAASMTRAALAGAAVLAGGVALLASPEALLEVSLLGVNGFHVGAVVMLSVFAGGLLAGGRFLVIGRAGPGLHVAAATLGCGALVLAIPPFRQPVIHGLTALGAASSWHGNIQEFDPIFLAGYQSFRREAAVALSLLGLTLPLAPVALVALTRRRPSPPIRAARWALLLWLGLSLIPLALVRRRFLVYAAVPLALWSASLAVTLARRATRHRMGGFAPLVAFGLLLAMLAPTWTWLARDRHGEDPGLERQALLEAATWLRGQDPAQPASPAVFAEWDFGHLIQYLSRKPVLVSPFGTDIGDEPMLDFARAFLTEIPDTVEAVMDRRRVGFVVLVNPVTEAYFAADYLPSGTPEYVTVRRDWRIGLDVTVNDAFWNTASSRLFFEDGAGRGGEALSPLRLVFEAGAPEVWEGREAPAVKVFERVNGARLVVRGAAPGIPVTVELALVTSTGRTARWSSTVVSDSAGTALLRVPYAAGLNRTTYATELRAHSGSRVARVAVSDEDVREGRELEVRLPPS